MILCDLCGQAKECVQKEIESKEFDICADCWRPLEEKLRGKGRTKKKKARDGFSATATRGGTLGSQDAAWDAAEDFRASGKGELTIGPMSPTGNAH